MTSCNIFTFPNLEDFLKEEVKMKDIKNSLIKWVDAFLYAIVMAVALTLIYLTMYKIPDVFYIFVRFFGGGGELCTPDQAMKKIAIATAIIFIVVRTLLCFDNERGDTDEKE
jgi:hypothetical protein